MSSRENVYIARICEVIVREYMRETVFFNIKDKFFSEIGHFHGTAFFEAGPGPVTFPNLVPGPRLVPLISTPDPHPHPCFSEP